MDVKRDNTDKVQIRIMYFYFEDVKTRPKYYEFAGSARVTRARFVLRIFMRIYST